MIETIPALILATQIINQPGSLLSGNLGQFSAEINRSAPCRR